MEHPVPSAAATALHAHGEQKYGNRPYVVHLVAVVENLHRFGVATDDLLAAGWLHDTVEDTDLPIKSIRISFGDTVADMVAAVTSEDGETRAERNKKTYPKIASTAGAVRLKLADRIANVEACWDSRHHKLFMYRDEYPAFRKALRDDGDHLTLAMWDHLDQLLGFAG